MRPNPEKILAEINDKSSRRGAGNLKIYIGMAAGVGKTYAMLQEAHELRARNVDVVVGYAECHGRKETTDLLQNLEILPLTELEYRGTKISEFDLDAALARKPEVIIVDELPHSNAPGSRHVKRWQDIAELLDSGIDVISAMNVQHLESLNDIVYQITGVLVKETVPDAIIEQASSIEVIDIPAIELRERLKEGKIYHAEKIDNALESFFKESNLVALRELALRKVADRIGVEVVEKRHVAGESTIWQTKQRILVCISPSKLAPKLVRTAARFASATHGEAIALWIDSTGQRARSLEDQSLVNQALKLAEEMGMETVILKGSEIPQLVSQVAIERNVSLIIVGKPIRKRWIDRIQTSLVDEIMRLSGEVDVHVVTEPINTKQKTAQSKRVVEARLVEGAYTFAAIALVTVFNYFFFSHLELANLAMIYLLAIALIASKFGPREAAIAAILSVLAFDFAFIPPRWTFAVTDSRYFITFAVMLGVGLLIGSLNARLRIEARESADRERVTASLFVLNRELSQSRGKIEIADQTIRSIKSTFPLNCEVWQADQGKLTSLAKSPQAQFDDSKEAAVREWVINHGEAAGFGTATLPSANGLYLPLLAETRAIGVIGLEKSNSEYSISPEDRQLLEAFAGSLSVALERARLAKESHEARILVEAERIRSALLSSISHDLRTPLTSIAGAASSLKKGIGDPQKLIDSLYEETVRMNAHVQNLMDIARLQSGDVKPNLEWHSIEEIIGASLNSLREALGNRKVITHLPDEQVFVQVDEILIQKALNNVIENACIHTELGTNIEISARVLSSVIEIRITDFGTGIKQGDEMKIFERSYRNGKFEEGGFGLGLSIARAVMKIHRGRIWVVNRTEGTGATFILELPKPDSQPEIPK